MMTKTLNIPMAEILSGRPSAVQNLCNLGINTLDDAITQGPKRILMAKRVGNCTVEEIEIAALQRNISLYTGEITPWFAHKFAEIVRREGGSVSI